MADFAKVDPITQKVLTVIAIADDRATSEEAGAAWCEELTGEAGWMLTTEDGFRGKLAAIGDDYDAQLDQFLAPIPPKPYKQWVLDGREWKPPMPRPNDLPEEFAIWAEDLGRWTDLRRRVDPTTWVLRFTRAETDLMLASDDEEVQQIVALQKSSPFIREDSPITLGSLQKLVAKNVLASHRPAEILAGANPT